MTDLCLADPVDAAEALFQPVRVPRQVVVDHQVAALQVDAFAGGVGRQQYLHCGSCRKASCTAKRSSRPTLPWMTTTDVWRPSNVVMRSCR